MFMTESKMILPKLNNQGVDLREHIQIIEGMIIDAFGGFTRVDSVGAYRADNGQMMIEAGYSYSIAHTDFADDDLWIIARKARTLLSQECIYLCINGQAHFVRDFPRLQAA